tara:strand:- start:11100 stop:11528 length:429 start_codon:yes stop_codon:yes gene_type:complete
MTNFNKVVNLFENQFGFKFIKNTRKKEYVEARAVFIHYLYNFEKLNLLEIQDLIYQYTGWRINHATIFHSLKNQPIYCKKNPKLDNVLKAVIEYFNNDRDKIEYVKNTVVKLRSNSINKIHKEVLKEYEKQVEVDIKESEYK